MEEGLNHDKEKLRELQERFFFSDLNEEDQAFVLRQNSREVFDLTHKIFLECKKLYIVPETRPLVLSIAHPSRSRQIIFSIATATAASIFTFLFFRKETVIVKVVEKPIYSIADTVFLQNKIVDTVIEYRECKTMVNNDKTNIIPHIEITSNRKSNEPIPPLTVIDSKNKGESMKEDNMISLMDGIFY